jgi:hypothetical protein
VPDPHRISLTAWPLNSQAGSHCIRLPGPVLRISAHRNQVGIVTAGYQILIWYLGEPGDPLKSVDNSGLDNRLASVRLTQALVVFHPLEQDCFFVVYEIELKRVALSQNHTRRIVVQEFTKEKLMATKLLDLDSFGALSVSVIGLLHDGIVSVSKVFVGGPSTGSESSAALESRHGFGKSERGEPNSKAATMVIFDIYQRIFISEDYCLPDSLRAVHRLDEVLEQAFHWRHQILLPMYGTTLEVEHMPGR